MPNMLLNELVDYIENHLCEEIDLDTCARILGLSTYNMQRIFTFVAGISISSYIRRRRLSCAYQDLAIHKMRVIDVSTKYLYESQISFSRAFKEHFGICPKDAKKGNSVSLYSKLNFKILTAEDKLTYEIKTISSFPLYVIVSNPLNKDVDEIKKLYNKIKTTGLYDVFNEHEMYGVSLNYDDGAYALGSKSVNKDLTKITINAGRYAVFKVNSRNSLDIRNMRYKIALTFDNAHLFDDQIDFEKYVDDSCELYFPLK